MISIPKRFNLGTFKTAKSLKDLIDGLINYQKPITLIDNSTVVWNLNKAYNVKITLAGNRTLQLVGLTEGDYGTIKIVQGGSGSYTLTLPSEYTNVVANAGTGVLTLSTTVGSIDIATFYYDGSVLNWTLSTDFT